MMSMNHVTIVTTATTGAATPVPISPATAIPTPAMAAANSPPAVKSGSVSSHPPARKEVRMKPRVTLITLGVDDLQRSLRFYRDGLGLATDGIVGQEYEHGAVAFFRLQSGLILALWARADIAFDTGLERSAPRSTEFALANNVSSREEVDATMAEAARAGA